MTEISSTFVQPSKLDESIVSPAAAAARTRCQGTRFTPQPAQSSRARARGVQGEGIVIFYVHCSTGAATAREGKLQTLRRTPLNRARSFAERYVQYNPLPHICAYMTDNRFPRKFRNFLPARPRTPPHVDCVCLSFCGREPSASSTPRALFHSSLRRRTCRAAAQADNCRMRRRAWRRGGGNGGRGGSDYYDRDGDATSSEDAPQ